MAIVGKLTTASRRRMLVFHALFVPVLLFNMCMVYLYFIQPFVQDPFLRTPAFWKYWLKTEPFWVLFSLLFVYLNVCLYVCSGFILFSPIIGAIWGQLKKFLPCRIRRRTWCFCNCSCKSLQRILKDIYDNQCDWEPQHPDSLDKVTKGCITLILDKCKEKLESPDMGYILVGSSAEGLGKPYTLDLQSGYLDPAGKFCLRFFCCCCPCSTSYTSLRTDFDINFKCQDGGSRIGGFVAMDTDHKCSSGFTRLVYTANNNSSGPWLSMCKESDGKYLLSSTLVRKLIYDLVDSTSESLLPASYIFGVVKHPPVVELEEKGPAVKLATYPLGQAWYWNEDQKFVSFEGDFVFGIHCLQGPWPECASGWPGRPRMWPSQQDVDVILKNGFMLVPKCSHQTSQLQDDLEWHISFPHSETYISHRMPKVAKACYLALKIILKTHLVYHFEDMKTYFLKTILLWELEKHPSSFWSLENLDECFLCLFDRVVECVNNQKCPNYWIEDLDLFQNVDKRELSALMPVLRKIRANPAPYIADVGTLWC